MPSKSVLALIFFSSVTCLPSKELGIEINNLVLLFFVINENTYFESVSKTLIITYYWPPSGGAGVHRWLALSDILADAGQEVHILTVRPEKASYLGVDLSLNDKVSKRVSVHHSDSWEPLQWYQRLTGGELPQGGGTGLPTGLKGRLLKWIRTHLFIPDARRGWIRFATARAGSLIEEYDIKNVIISSPPHSSQLIGLQLKRKYNINLIADFRDPWTDLYYIDALGSSRYSRSINQSLERKVLENADWVIAVGKRLSELLASKASETLKSIVVHNGFEGDLNKLSATQDQNPGLTIVYTGKLTNQFPCYGLISALNHLKRSWPSAEIVLRIAGPVQSEISSTLLQSAECEIDLVGTLPHERMAELQSKSSILLLIIPTGDRNDLILTGKLFEYLKADRPILCLGPEQGDAADIIRETNTGMVFTYGDHQGIGRWLDLLMSGQWTYNPTREKILQYSRRQQGIKILDILE